MAGDVWRVLAIEKDRTELSAALKECDFTTSRLSRLGWEAYRRGEATRYTALLLTSHGGFISAKSAACVRKRVPYRWKGRDTGAKSPKVRPDA